LLTGKMLVPPLGIDDACSTEVKVIIIHCFQMVNHPFFPHHYQLFQDFCIIITQ